MHSPKVGQRVRFKVEHESYPEGFVPAGWLATVTEINPDCLYALPDAPDAADTSEDARKVRLWLEATQEWGGNVQWSESVLFPPHDTHVAWFWFEVELVEGEG